VLPFAPAAVQTVASRLPAAFFAGAFAGAFFVVALVVAIRIKIMQRRSR
jgi:hypothetical protein